MFIELSPEEPPIELEVEETESFTSVRCWHEKASRNSRLRYSIAVCVIGFIVRAYEVLATRIDRRFVWCFLRRAESARRVDYGWRRSVWLAPDGRCRWLASVHSRALVLD